MENSLKIQTFNQICRTCLSITENLSPLLENDVENPAIELLECLNILKVEKILRKNSKNNFLILNFPAF